MLRASLVISSLILLAVIYFYKKRMVNHAYLVDVSAEIDRIKIGSMSPSHILDSPRARPPFQVKSASDHEQNIIAVPEIEIFYSYYYQLKRYSGRAYVLLSQFLSDMPYHLDFSRFGLDFPVLILPDREITGEENIETFLLNRLPEITIQVDTSNPHLSVVSLQDDRV